MKKTKALFSSIFLSKASTKSNLSALKKEPTDKLPPNSPPSKRDELEEQTLKDAFTQYDQNGDNLIQKGELKNVLSKYYKKEPTERQLGKIMSKVDLNEDGVIQFVEFRKMMGERVNTKNEIRTNFEEFDVNKDGFITREELKKVLNTVEAHDDEEIAEILDVADLDRDGKINFEEFMEFFM